MEQLAKEFDGKNIIFVRDPNWETFHSNLI